MPVKGDSEVLPTGSTSCLMTEHLQRDSSFLPVGTGDSTTQPCWLLSYQSCTQKRNQTPCKRRSPRRTLRDVWKHVIYHPSTHNRHHSLTQSPSATGRIHTCRHPQASTHHIHRSPPVSGVSRPALDGSKGSNPFSASLPSSSLPSLA